jgi:FkbM family methyltransferase
LKPTLFRADRSLQAKVQRALSAIVVEHRLPNKLGRMVDNWRKSPDRPFKLFNLRGTRLRVRRGSRDLEMACTVLTGEYALPGYQIEPNDIVIDIGANVGSFAIFASRQACAGMVFTFEPDPTAFTLLQENLKLNGITNARPVHAAVGGSDGTTILHLDESHTGRASLYAEHVHVAGQEFEVPLVSLRTILDSNGIDRCNFLKLDCEGAEFEILYSLPPEYFARIDRIAMEYHGSQDSAERHQKAEALVDFLLANGYVIDNFTDNLDADCGKIFARHSGIAGGRGANPPEAVRSHTSGVETRH